MEYTKIMVIPFCGEDFLFFDYERLNIYIARGNDFAEWQLMENNIIQISNDVLKEKFSEFDFSAIEIINNNTIKKLTINVANACNLQCTYCYANNGNYYKPDMFMDSVTADKISQAIVNSYYPIESILFFGGEPLLNFSAIEQIVSHLKNAFFNGDLEFIPEFSIVTNGTILDDHILKFLKQNNVTLTVSVDFPKIVHDESRPYRDRGTGSYKNIMKNVKRLKRCLGKLALELTYNEFHFKKKYSLIDVYQSIDTSIFDSILIGYSYEPFGYGNEYVCAFNQQYIMLIERYMDDLAFGKKTPRIVYIDAIISTLIEKKVDQFLCPRNRHTRLVFVDGKVYPCQFYVCDDYCLGDITNLSNHIYMNDCFDNKNGLCQNCWLKHICKMCPGLMEIETGKRGLIKNCEINRYCSIYKEWTMTIIKKLASIMEGKHSERFITAWHRRME